MIIAVAEKLRKAADYWEIIGDKAIRHHIRPD